ncbi:MAG: HlyD family secretion protein, partial [Hyphomonas sp.]|nr:HlyD family secretion protein [Hyphomonas sp.]
MAVKPFKIPDTKSEAPTPSVAPPSLPDPADAVSSPAGGVPQGLLEKFRADPRKYILSGLGAVLAAFAVWQGVHWFAAGRFEETTDNAYIRADIAYIAPKVQGYVEQVHVSDNQAVKAGDLLVTLEVADYAARIAEADAALQQAVADAQQARARVASAEAALETAGAQVSAQRDRLTQMRAQSDASAADASLAAADLERFTELAGKGHYPKAGLDAAATKETAARATLAQSKAAVTASQSELGVAQASYHRAEEDLTAAKAAVESANARIEAAKARVDAARIDATRTELRAPFDGVIANRMVAEGQLLNPGQQAMAVVPMSEAYVIANFKETQVARMLPGQTVRLHVDAYPGLHVEGAVDSIAPATGGQFSLI